MKQLSEVLRTPSKDTVIVIYKSIKYNATEEDIRHLQYLVHKGDLQADYFTVIDHDELGTPYEMIMRTDGLFSNEFTSNIFTFNSDLALKVL